MKCPYMMTWHRCKVCKFTTKSEKEIMKHMRINHVDMIFGSVKEFLKA